jgi:hypothetical protein
MVYSFGHAAPPTIAERLMAAVYGIGKYRAFWKRGAVIETRISKALLLLELRAIPRPQAGTDSEEEGCAGTAAADSSSFELAIETRGPKSKRADLWRVILQLRARTEELLAEWPEFLVEPDLCCPNCQKHGKTPTRWPTGSRSPSRQQTPTVPICPRCSEPVDLIGITARGAYVERALSLTMPPDVEKAVPPNPAPLKLGQPIQASFSIHRLLGTEKRQLEELTSRREQQIVDEIRQFGCKEADPCGWTDADWLRYILESEVEELELPAGMPSDILDRGHAGMNLDAFAQHPTAVAAKLDRAHVLALRLATCSVFRRITGPLFTGCTEADPHPYPALVALLNEAILALQHAAVESGATVESTLWRGVSNMEVTDELLERGGTIIAPTSFSRDLEMAKDNAAAHHAPKNLFPPCILKIRSGSGDGEALAAVDVRWCSCYPREAEYLLPPGVYLHCPNGGQNEVLEPRGKHGPFVQIELVPTPLKGAWVPAVVQMQQHRVVSGAGGSRTPRGRGLCTPRASSSPLGYGGEIATGGRGYGRGASTIGRLTDSSGPEAVGLGAHKTGSTSGLW